MRTLFIGGTKRGYLTLKALLDHNAQVVGIICLEQDEHEIERYEEPIKRLAEQYNIPCYQTKWMKDQDYSKIVSLDIQPDIALVVGCRILIPKEIYEIPHLGTLAVHDSYLPEYRGFAPLNWAILNGEDHMGVSLFYLGELMDGGDIVGQKRTPIGPDDTAPEVYERVCQATADLALEAYPLLAKGQAPRIKQDYSVGTFTCSRTPTDGIIDWNKSTRAIYNQIRALTWPYPGAFTFYQGRKLLVWKARLIPTCPNYVGRIPGRVVSVSQSDGSVNVLTGDGVLQIFEVQLAGEGKVPAARVITSVRVALGVSVEELLERIRVLEEQVAEHNVVGW